MGTDKVDPALEKLRFDMLRQEMLAPILSIVGHATLIHEHFQPGGGGQADVEVEDIERISKAAQQSSELASSLLDLGTNTSLPQQEQEAQQNTILHDLRNSLGIVAGYSEIILEDLADADAEDKVGVNYLGLLISESNTVLERLSDLTIVKNAEDSNLHSEVERELTAVLESFQESANQENAVTGHILVVDDNESNRNLLQHQLEKQGHTTSLAPSGRQAHKMLLENPPDLVLLDLLMQDMNGFELLNIMKGDDALRSIPVIIVTGLQHKDTAARCIKAGAFEILLKPINPTLLQARVMACLERKHWRDKEKEYKKELEKSYSFIRKVFGRYVSDEVVQTLLDSDEGLQLGGGKQKVTIMMTDIRGFSALSQALDPVNVVQLLNNYLGVMTPLLLKYGATIDEFLGDAILSIFGAPVSAEDDSQRAIACAIEMQLAMTEVNEKNKQLGLPEIQMGIGVNTGEVVVGNIGSIERSKYGVVGHHVNLTARVESFTVGGQIMATEYTLADVDVAVELGNMAEVQAKGIKGAIRIHEILGIGAPFDMRLPTASSEWLDMHTELAVDIAQLAGKQIQAEFFKGDIVAISENLIAIRCDSVLEILGNYKLLLVESNVTERREMYAKVTAEPIEQDGCLIFHMYLTSISEEIRTILRSSAK